MAAGKKIPSSFIKWISACSQSDETPAAYLLDEENGGRVQHLTWPATEEVAGVLRNGR